jgi:Kef-type K+ transport system membrane component KefB
MTLALFLVAIGGKIVAGLGVRQKGVHRLVVGVGMIPRGEVGLIFASLGKQMDILTGDVYSAVVVMLALTTFIAPPGLRWLLREPPLREKREEALPPAAANPDSKEENGNAP